MRYLISFFLLLLIIIIPGCNNIYLKDNSIISECVNNYNSNEGKVLICADKKKFTGYLFVKDNFFSVYDIFGNMFLQISENRDSIIFETPDNRKSVYVQEKINTFLRQNYSLNYNLDITFFDFNRIIRGYVLQELLEIDFSKKKIDNEKDKYVYQFSRNGKLFFIMLNKRKKIEEIKIVFPSGEYIILGKVKDCIFTNVLIKKDNDNYIKIRY